MAGVINTHTFGNRGAGHFVIGHLDPNKSNEEIIIAANSGDLEAGTVLGELTATPGTYAPLDPAASDGTEEFDAILWADKPNSTTTQKAAATVRDAVVKGHALKYVNALNTAQLATMVGQAEDQDIIVRD